MLKTVTIGDVEVEILSNAATPYRYNMVFHDDLILKTANGMNEAEAVEIAPRLCYIMAQQAQKGDLSKLSEDRFLTWLEQFEFMDVIEASGDIIEAYIASKKTSSVPK